MIRLKGIRDTAGRVEKFLPTVLTCNYCPLSGKRRNIVVGYGVLPATILFIGEAPDKAEDLLGEGYCGILGNFMSRMIVEAGLSEFDIFLTYCLFCRPCNTRGGETREPAPEEILSCAGNVQSVLAACKRPKTVILMGKTAIRYYGKEFPYAARIIHPDILIRGGGDKNPYYLNTIQTLKGVANELKNK